MPPKLVVRDAVVLALTVVAVVVDAEQRLGSGWVGGAAGVVTGALVALSGFLLHEWGHLAGSLGSGAEVFYPSRLAAPLLFHFDVKRNDRRQFLWMSAGGYIASALGLAVVWWLVRLDAWSGRTALLLAGGGTLVTVIVEVPTTIRVARGQPLPGGYAFRDPG
jgi:hypothetical protein